MVHIETSFSVRTTPDQLFEALSEVGNIPLYTPAVQEATPVPDAAEGLVDLVLRTGRSERGRIHVDPQAHALTFQDHRGNRARWELRVIPDGTRASLTIDGFEEQPEEEVAAELQAKLARFLLALEDRVDPSRVEP